MLKKKRKEKKEKRKEKKKKKKKKLKKRKIKIQKKNLTFEAATEAHHSLSFNLSFQSRILLPPNPETKTKDSPGLIFKVSLKFPTTWSWKLVII